MSVHETPGLYVGEVPQLPPGITEAETAIPGFVGYTATATNAALDDLRFKPTLVRSMVDFVEFFGDSGAAGAVAHVSDSGGAPVVERVDPPSYHPLYFALQLYFDNGGRQCYVVSVGTRSGPGDGLPSIAALTQGIEALAQQDEVTLLVVPEATSLAPADYGALTTAMLAQCAAQRDRFALFDLYDGANPRVDVTASRRLFPEGGALAYGAVYYPYLSTTLTFPYVESPSSGGLTSNALVRVNGSAPVDVVTLREKQPVIYGIAVAALREQPVVIPPSGAVVGAYVRSDREQGVWKAPANLQLQNVFAPVTMLTQAQSDRLNVDADGGKSVNTIRAFPGKGTLVWGARTLAGNDAEWRYVPVRRFLTVIEESISKSTQWVVFEPNDANTWAMVRASIENYLTTKWRDGGLIGTTPKEAFFVHCGLGQTMTAQDVADGRLIVEIGVAPVRPAEFIVIRISHRMAGSES